VPKNIEEQMRDKGYIKVDGVAILNDVVVTETAKDVLSPKLATNESVSAFNDERGDGWSIYRRLPIIFDEMAVFQ
jgi:hypothetical protein